ncbi:MAG: RsmE family RNA methyltransferase [Candidatus Limiplasma sp.]|nr:RsmE family RNA methyltransferase [Candidatus Limiplasma sp.]
MHRFVTEERISGVGEEVILGKEESVHASKVLRLRTGENVQLIDGENRYDAALTAVSSEETRARVTALCPSPEAPARAVLWQGLPKADKLELIAQKATELGAWEIWPVEMLRSVARLGKNDPKKQERLSRIALEAAKQSGRAHVPEVREAVSFENGLKRLAEEPFDLILIAWEEEHALPLSRAVEEYRQSHGEPKRVLIVIGPEGGVDETEQQRLAALGARSVTLGPRILRTETAGLCALAALWTAMGEM